jgi:hypothetical protein
MDAASAGIESELPDLSTVNVSNLRGVELTGLSGAMARVLGRIVDAEESISGYNGNGAIEPSGGASDSSPEGNVA